MKLKLFLICLFLAISLPVGLEGARFNGVCVQSENSITINNPVCIDSGEGGKIAASNIQGQTKQDYPRGLGIVAIAGPTHDEVSAATLTTELRKIKAQYTPITLQQFKDWYNYGSPLPHKPILVTYDEGHLIQYTDYAPVHRTLNIPAVIFIVSGFLEGDPIAYEGKTPMSWAQARELKAEGLIDIESHSGHHWDMSEMTRAQADTELAYDLNLWQTNMLTIPTVLAYPYGYYNSDVQAAAKAAGFDMAMRVGCGASGADAPFVSMPVSVDNYRWAINRAGKIVAGRRFYYTNLIPSMILNQPSSDSVWTLATGSSYLTDASGDVALRLVGSTGEPRFNTSVRLPVSLGQFYHVEFKSKGTFSSGNLRVQLQYYGYDEAWIENVALRNITGNDADYVKSNLEWRVSNPLHAWVEVAIYSDTTGNNVDVKAVGMQELMGLDYVGGTRRLLLSTD